MRFLIKPIFLLVVLALFSLFAFNQCESPVEPSDNLFKLFQDPPADARPMVRWWWNGNSVEQEELKRQLHVLHAAGIGGVEINSIAMPPHAKKTDAKALQWAGKKWCDMVKYAALEAKELGMITDLIVGSGWPFGGRFLKDDETMQRLGIKKQLLKAKSHIEIDVNDYLKFKSHHTETNTGLAEHSDVELISAKLIPVHVGSLEQVIDVTGEIQNGKLELSKQDKDYWLVFLYNERHFKSVYHGSPGADGPIMDHYKKEVVWAYLERLKALEEETGYSLSDLIRALFCDSIELGGSNWSDDMKQQFKKRNGYDISGYLSFVVQPPTAPNTFECSPEFADELKRVQYDYYNTLVDLFLERFTKVFQDYCTQNNVLCRYQAYGTPYYMGLFQGNMIPDIPESNNWIYSRGRDEAANDAFTWSTGHGYMLWNKAASSAANISGKKIVSCEAMTNTQGVFRTSLETIKQADDMNFITGMNHAVLHGYNYSPTDAGFPGWMRYGAYFSEQNTWWNYFRNWSDYNARLSVVFQNSKAVPDIAVLGRLRDYWGEIGPVRPVFNYDPWYYARLWEPLSNLGYSCDYIHQPVLENARIEGKELVCGEMRYRAIWLSQVESLTPQAAQKLREFATVGGKVVFIGHVPQRSLSFIDAESNDLVVQEAIAGILPMTNVLKATEPEEDESFLQWTRELLQQTELESGLRLGKGHSYLYTLKKKTDNKDIYFFANSSRSKALELKVQLDLENKYPCLWNPETGERFAIQGNGQKELTIYLSALESALIILENTPLDLPLYSFDNPAVEFTSLHTSWEVQFNPVHGDEFSENWNELQDLSYSTDPAIRNFSGTITYTTEVDDSAEYIRLGDCNQGVTELFVNDQPAGMNWYGEHKYYIKDLVQPGNNKINIKLTTTLANYCMSLKDNPTARAWTSRYKGPFTSGLLAVETGKSK